MKKRQKCKIVESEKGYGHDFALKLLMIGIKVLNRNKIIKYILYFKSVSLKTMYTMCPLLPSNRKI